MSDVSSEHDEELSLLSDMVADVIFTDPHTSKSTLKGPCADSYYQPDSLVNLGCKAFAEERPFEVVYSAEKPIPEHIQKTIAQYSFPSTSREIEMYSGLGTGSKSCFHKASFIFMQNGVRDCLQIGFYISANVIHSTTDKKIRQ
ncbi:unnamed protein product, partial [Hymenolepis diminuta]